MPRFPNCVRGVILAATFWFAAPVALAADANTAADLSLLRCKGKDSFTLAENGELGADKKDIFVRKYSNFVVDTLTGTISNDNAQPLYWGVVSPGDAASDIVLAPPSDLINAETDFLRIRAWEKGKPIRYFMVLLTSVYSGVCEPVG